MPKASLSPPARGSSKEEKKLGLGVKDDELEEGPLAKQENVTWGGLLSGIVSMIFRSTAFR